MARLLLTTFGSLGDLRPFLALARALAARGHDTVLATHAEYRDEVEAAGIGFRPVRPGLGDLGGPEALRPAVDLRRGTEHVIRRLVVPFLRGSRADLLAAAADREAIVGHVLTFAAPIVAGERGIPYLHAALQPVTFFSAHDPPVLAGPPGANLLLRVAPRLLWSAARLVTAPWIAPVHRLRAEAGLPPTRRHPLLDAHSDVLNVALFSPLLASPQPDWPPHTVVAGFPRPTSPERLPDALEAFLAAGPPPVVFTLGSSAVWDPGAFFRDGARAARALGVRAVLLAGAAADDPTLAGEGIFVTGYAPHGALFARARANVHQGGIGTTGAALRAGRPMLILPWSHDQPDNAARCARLGVARVLPRGAGAKRLERSLAAVLADEATRVRAAEIGARVREEDGGEVGAEAIERALERKGMEAPRLRE